MSSTKAFLPEENYSVPLLSGMSFCVTGMDQTHRNEIEEAVRAVGGTFSRALKKDCTHLICGTNFVNTNSDKVEFAEKSGMYIVRSSWLTDSISRKQLQEEGAYDTLSSSGKQMSGAGEENVASSNVQLTSQPNHQRSVSEAAVCVQEDNTKSSRNTLNGVGVEPICYPTVEQRLIRN
jgi:hypothetical protein